MFAKLPKLCIKFYNSKLTAEFKKKSPNVEQNKEWIVADSPYVYSCQVVNYIEILNGPLGA